MSYSLQVKAFSRSQESLKTAIVVGGTNIAEQVTNLARWLCFLLLKFQVLVREWILFFSFLIVLKIIWFWSRK